EYLHEQIRQKDQIIRSLLKQVGPVQLPFLIQFANPIRLQLQNRYISSLSSRGNYLSDAANQAIPSDLRARVNGRGSDVFLEESSDQSQEDVEGEDDHAIGLPDASAPLGLIAKLSLSNSHRKRGGAREWEPVDPDGNDIGVANAAYFEPGPAANLRMRARLLKQHSPPELLMHGIVVSEDVTKLFEISCSCTMKPFISLLDPVLYTPTSTFTRCPVLFTVVCAVSARYYTEKSEIYPIAMQFAKRSAANALNEGWKTIELCQAYILLSIYSVPVHKWEEDCSWLYSGIAVRLATDLNLHQALQSLLGTEPKRNEKQERELLNRTRVWLICFNLDYSVATQSGKPPTIKPDFVMKRRSDDWYRLSPYNSAYDLNLCATTEFLLVLADFHDQIFSDTAAPSGLNKHVDFRSVTTAHDAKLAAFSHKWTNRLVQQSKLNSLLCTLLCATLLPFPFTSTPDSVTAYSRLIMFSFALEQACRTGLESTDYTLCLESAKNVLHSMIDGLASTGFIRYCPDGHFMIVAFASAVLLKLLGPEFSYFMPAHEETQVYDLVRQVIRTLSSSAIAVDDRHAPKLYAHFLDRVLSRQYWDNPVHGHLHHQRTILEGILGQWSSNYASSMSSIWGGVAACSDQETDRKQDVHRGEAAPTSIHYPIAMHNGQIRHNTVPYNELA
ncbi:hypothetical protein C8R45DRAFT_1165247, partial [Mycena sanguinolenta]